MELFPHYILFGEHFIGYVTEPLDSACLNLNRGKRKNLQKMWRLKKWWDLSKPLVNGHGSAGSIPVIQFQKKFYHKYNKRLSLTLYAC